MKVKTICSLVSAAVLAALLYAAPARAGVRIYVSVPPPPLIVETRPPAPSPAHVWIAGFHRWDGHAYVWVPGHYAVRPRVRAVWAPGRWVHHRRGWYWREGRWR